MKSYNLELLALSDEGCRDSTSLTLSVYPNVVADFDFVDDSAGCAPHTVEFDGSISQNEDYYFWDFGDGNTSGQGAPIHRFTNTEPYDTTYEVTLNASSAYECADEITKTVTVYSQPNAEFNVEPYVQTFPENRVFIYNRSNEGEPEWEYNWAFGDEQNSDEAEPNYHDYEHWGEYDDYRARVSCPACGAGGYFD